jgi:hypothetical protein
MIDLMHQLEVGTNLAEKDREARSALRVSEVRSGRRGSTAGFRGWLARLGTRTKRDTSDLRPSRGTREPSVHKS